MSHLTLASNIISLNYLCLMNLGLLCYTLKHYTLKIFPVEYLHLLLCFSSQYCIKMYQRLECERLLQLCLIPVALILVVVSQW